MVNSRYSVPTCQPFPRFPRCCERNGNAACVEQVLKLHQAVVQCQVKNAPHDLGLRLVHDQPPVVLVAFNPVAERLYTPSQRSSLTARLRPKDMHSRIVSRSNSVMLPSKCITKHPMVCAVSNGSVTYLNDTLVAFKAS